MLKNDKKKEYIDWWYCLLLRGEPGLSGGRQYGKGFAWIPVWVDYRERYFEELQWDLNNEILSVFDVVSKTNFNVKWVCIQ